MVPGAAMDFLLWAVRPFGGRSNLGQRRPYICNTSDSADATMSRQKTETLSIRTSTEIKELIRLAAEKEHRSVASMIEVLVLAYARKNHLAATAQSEGAPQQG